jgi:ATP-dependent 26S proteasome regulatory subunit
MIVIEDVDLIARARETMYGPCDESILNKLLNEMDGLREDAAVLFILTTNRPDSLEAALASRPGRIDQAIEFPLPDENGRRLLVRLYACGLPLDESVVETIVRRTDKASAAFIKELMRRAAQFYIQNGSDGRLQLADVNAALEEMLFTGGSLNAKLLGAADVTPTAALNPTRICQ